MKHPLLLGLLFCGLLPLVYSASTGAAGPAIDSHYRKACADAACHPAKDAGRIHTHQPYLEQRCLECHVDHAAPAVPGLLKTRADSLCLNCHKEVALDAGGKTHAAWGKTCIECHSPHQSALPGLLRDATIEDDCSECHEDFLLQSLSMPYRHKHFDPRGECGVCHYAHQRGDKKYLRPNVAETCLTCHDLPIAQDKRVLENVAQGLRQNPVVHQPMHSGESCPTCHTPHGAAQPSLLKPGYPAGNYQQYEPAQYALCWQCHDPAMVESRTGAGATNFHDATRNLHRVHVAELKRGRVCGVCHEPHSSDTPDLLRHNVHFGQWNAPLKVTLTAEGGACATPCHRDKEYNRATTQPRSEQNK